MLLRFYYITLVIETIVELCVIGLNFWLEVKRRLCKRVVSFGHRISSVLYFNKENEDFKLGYNHHTGVIMILATLGVLKYSKHILFL